MRIPISPRPHQDSLLSIFSITAILVNVRGSRASTCSTSHFKAQIKYDPEELGNAFRGKFSYSLLRSTIIYLCPLVPTHYLLSTYYMPSIILGEETVNKTKFFLKMCPYGAYILFVEKQTIKSL